MIEATPTQEIQLKLLAMELEMENSFDGLTQSKKLFPSLKSIQLLRNQVLDKLGSKLVDIEKITKSVDSLESKCNYYKRDFEMKGFKMTNEINEFFSKQHETVDLIRDLLKNKK